MLRSCFDWLDSRTGYRRLWAPIRHRVLPNGPSWGLTTAVCLLWLFVIQMITGLLLMTTYSPSTTTAWASVHYIEQSSAGSFIRGIHHYTSHAMIILFAVHVARVLLTGAFRAPRELVWITGLLLVPLMIVWTVTGNPLPATQKGLAQIEVEGNIIGSTPVVGPFAQRLLIGGDEVGHLTLTHLYFLHVGLMPLLVIGLLLLHVSQVYRHGLTERGSVSSKPLLPYFPYQTVRNLSVLGVLLSTLAILSWKVGAPLSAPADPNLTHQPRPEWYFRSLFEMRRYFTGDWEFVATLVIPLSILLFFLLLPLVDRVCTPRWSAALRLLVVVTGIASWGGLTWVSFARDWGDPEHMAAETQSQELAQRARILADREQIPPQGAIALLRNDPKTQGPLLFERHCASCHTHQDAAGHGIAAAEPSAPNLYGFGTTEWIAGLLDPQRIAGPHYFGPTKFATGDMAGRMQELFDGVEGEEFTQLKIQLAAVSRALSAEAALPGQAQADRHDAAQIAKGTSLLTGDLACIDCHRFHDHGDLGSAPDLTGYASGEWLRGMIGNPAHERFYPNEQNDRMPAFFEDATHPDRNLLSPRELDMLVHWLRGEWNQSTPDSPAENPAGSPQVAYQELGRARERTSHP